MNSKYSNITKESLGIQNKDTNGLVIVVDLDNTLVGDYFNVTNSNSAERIPIFNENLVSLLKKAREARRKGTVTAIFLLTNNADTQFIQLVNILLAERGANGYNDFIFDYVMSRNHEARQRNYEKTGRLNPDPPKSLEDVAFMMREIGEFPVNLEKRVYFIDDRSDHKIRDQLATPEQYITITPAFYGKEKDETNYSDLQKKLESFQRGGGRHNRKTRRGRKHLIKRKSRKFHRV
jgi:predicted GNAT superfamily acetyltransferase